MPPTSFSPLGALQHLIARDTAEAAGPATRSTARAADDRQATRTLYEYLLTASPLDLAVFRASAPHAFNSIGDFADCCALPTGHDPDEPLPWHDPKAPPPTQVFAPADALSLRLMLAQSATGNPKCRARGRDYDFGNAGETSGTLFRVGDSLKGMLPVDHLRANLVAANYLRFAGGTTLKEIQDHLPAGRMLFAQPGCESLTFAGVMTSGGQGAGVAPNRGALSESVRSLELMHLDATGHVVLSRIEPASAPLTDAVSFAAAFPPPDHRLVQDDALFHAAVVSMGMLGVITSITIETEPSQNVLEERRKTTWEQAFAQLGADLADPDLHSLELWVNPYFTDGTRTCIRSTRRLRPDAPRKKRGLGMRIGTRTAFCAIASLFESLPSTIPMGLDAALASTEASDVVMLPRQGFDFGATNLAPVISAGIAIPVDPANLAAFKTMADDAFDWVAMQREQQGRNITNPMGMRFVGPAKAYMSPAYQQSIALMELCSFEMTANVRTTIEEGLSYMLTLHGAAGVRPHWGLMSRMTKTQFEASWSAASRQAFKAARAHFDPKGVFDNALTQRLGL